jgi:hypothetical protein
MKNLSINNFTTKLLSMQLLNGPLYKKITKNFGIKVINIERLGLRKFGA